MLTDIKPGLTLVFTAEGILKNSDNFIRIDYLKETGLSTQNIGTRCTVKRIGNDHIVLDCPNGEYQFTPITITQNFKKCPREVAFKILNI